MSRKGVRRDNPPALFLCPPLSSRTRCGHQVIPHPDAGFRDTDKITRKIHFSGPRITCGVTPFVMPPSMRSPSHPVPRCGIQRIPSSVIPSSNAAPWSCRLRCGHQVIPHPDAGSRDTRLCHTVLQCSTPVMSRFEAVSRNIRKRVLVAIPIML